MQPGPPRQVVMGAGMFSDGGRLDPSPPRSSGAGPYWPLRQISSMPPLTGGRSMVCHPPEREPVRACWLDDIGRIQTAKQYFGNNISYGSVRNIVSDFKREGQTSMFDPSRLKSNGSFRVNTTSWWFVRRIMKNVFSSMSGIHGVNVITCN